MKFCKALLLCVVMLHIGTIVYAKKVRVLFLGNSYTYVNDLPNIVANMAASTGDTLIYDMSAPGGQTFSGHLDPFTGNSLQKIKAGGWDYVVLQEQSQMCAYPTMSFDIWCYPYAEQLVDTVKASNPCAEVIFYMTWGRKNGDVPGMCNGFPGWTHFCTYHAMDSVIRERYMLMGDSFNTTVSPVGAVWRYLRTNHPSIELYDADGSHPSPAGSYAGGCSFYTAIFKKPADSIKYNFSLSATTAATIRTAASRVVYDSMSYWQIAKHETFASFSHNASSMAPVAFTNKSSNAIQSAWDFGDGATSTATSPTHTYTLPGNYTVRLIATDATGCSDTTYTTINLQNVGVATHNVAAAFTVSPNPVKGILYIKSGEFVKSNYRMQILNSMGQLVHQQQTTATSIQHIDVSGIAAGVYTLHISNASGEMYREKIVVQ